MFTDFCSNPSLFGLILARLSLLIVTCEIVTLIKIAFVNICFLKMNVVIFIGTGQVLDFKQFIVVKIGLSVCVQVENF